MSRSLSEDLLAGRYRLVEPIGSGGTAEVHRGWDTLLRRHVAVKLFPPGMDAATARRFDNEVRTLAALSHPGLVAVSDADTDGASPFVVMQLIEGHTLREEIDRGPMPPDRVRRLGAGLADALAYVHDLGLVHRDVKPSNILLDGEDNAHLADFGLVHLTGATRLTRTDQVVGTAAYLAPEQVLGREVDRGTDVYALGLVLLECLTGRREYEGSEVEAAVARLHRRPAVPEHLPADLRDLLVAMTAGAPEKRPEPQECVRVLSAASGVVAAGTVEKAARSGDTEITEVLRPPGQRGVWRTLAGSTVALLAAMAVTTALKFGLDPATSEPASPAQPPKPAAQPSSQETGSPGDQPPDAAVPVVAPSHTTETSVPAPSQPPTTSAATTPAPTSAPEEDEDPVVTTTPVPPTTTDDPPATTPVPTTGSSGAEESEDPVTRP